MPRLGEVPPVPLGGLSGFLSKRSWDVHARRKGGCKKHSDGLHFHLLLVPELDCGLPHRLGLEPGVLSSRTRASLLSNS